MELKEILLKARINKGYKQSEMDSLLGLCRNSFQKYEAGKKKPSLETLINISKILDIDLNDLKK